MDLRLSRLAYLGIWLILVGTQAAAAWVWLPGQAWTPLILTILVVQLAKVPLSVARLNQLALPKDDALFGLLPLANIGLWLYLLRGDPDEKLRAQRLAKLTGTSAFEALVWAIGVMVRNGHLTIPLALLAGVPGGLLIIGVDWMTGWLMELDDETRRMVIGGAWVACIPFAGYLVIQLIKAKTASWPSWIPALLFVPALMFALGALWSSSSAVIEMQLGVPIGLAAIMLWTLLLEPIAIGGFVVVASDARAGKPPSLRRIQELLGQRLGHLVTFHGTVFIIVQLGMLVVIPGIIYAVQSAFTQPIAVLRPDEQRPIRRSFDLARPLWRTIFKVMLVSWLLLEAVTVAATLGLGALLPMISPWFDSFDARAILLTMGMQLLGAPPDGTHSAIVVQPVVVTLTVWIWGIVRVACTRLAEEQLDKQANAAAAAAA